MLVDLLVYVVVPGVQQFVQNDTTDDMVTAKLDEDIEKSDELEMLPCEQCENVFKFHKDLKDSMCESCKGTIAEKVNIHLPDNFLCDVCLKSFRARNLDFEANGFTFTCEFCSILWRDEEAFEDHMQQKHTNHTCVRCNMKVEGKEKLDQNKT